MTADGGTIDAESIGAAWLDVAARIVADGEPGTWEGLPLRQLRRVTLEVERADPDDAIIARLADPERLEWMHANFTDYSEVEALGGAASYASRLFDYGRTGLDQLNWVVRRLSADPAAKDAAITTFEPLTDSTYIPCVSLLDFWIPDEAVELVVYCHGIDFGAKGYGNLVELAHLQTRVAEALGLPAGRLTMVVKSAHIYDSELGYMRGVLATAGDPEAPVFEAPVDEDPEGRGNSPHSSRVMSMSGAFRPIGGGDAVPIRVRLPCCLRGFVPSRHHPIRSPRAKRSQPPSLSA
ncbi:thymidylate synthase [Naasia aerilata]|uniref:Thymidylate synthase/dCMP hydroxymethylase domain-containing protein n=1 Tax=Naasia aerilata TaxID=1162966 RepID=A0ABM8GF94_9MICO|nr:thymidylate synthase [Naasia aerilata]BDZ47012.1 hypothetical protein GCM10025866_29210 [Naasia aerilata]